MRSVRFSVGVGSDVIGKSWSGTRGPAEHSRCRSLRFNVYMFMKLVRVRDVNRGCVVESDKNCRTGLRAGRSEGFQTHSVGRAICVCMIVYGAAKGGETSPSTKPSLSLSSPPGALRLAFGQSLTSESDAPRTGWPFLTLSKQLGSVSKLNSLNSTRLSTACALYQEHDGLLWGQVRSGIGT